MPILFSIRNFADSLAYSASESGLLLLFGGFLPVQCHCTVSLILRGYDGVVGLFIVKFVMIRISMIQDAVQ